MALDFKVRTVKGQIFTVALLVAVVGGGFVGEANFRAGALQDRLNQQEQAFMDLAEEFQEYKKANPEKR